MDLFPQRPSSHQLAPPQAAPRTCLAADPGTATALPRCRPVPGTSPTRQSPPWDEDSATVPGNVTVALKPRRPKVAVGPELTESQNVVVAWDQFFLDTSNLDFHFWRIVWLSWIIIGARLEIQDVKPGIQKFGRVAWNSLTQKLEQSTSKSCWLQSYETPCKVCSLWYGSVVVAPIVVSKNPQKKKMPR